MSWYIVIGVALLTVNIFSHGQTSGKELPMDKVSKEIKEIKINIPDDGKSESVILIPDMNDTMSAQGSQVDNPHFRHVRAADVNNNGKKEEDLPSEILTQILNALSKMSKMNMTEVELVKRFWCRINVTEISDIDGEAILEATSLMDKDIDTCPLEKEIALIEPFVKMLAQAKIPTAKEIFVMVNNTLYQMLSPEDIAKAKNSSEGIIFLILEKMIDYFEKNPEDSIFKMLGGLLCSIEKVDLTKLSSKTFIDMINNIGKTTCSAQQQKVILEKFVRMFSIRRWLNPENIFSFLNSDMFRLLTKIIDVPDAEMTAVLVVISTLEKIKIVDWTILDFGERLLCNLDQTNFTQIEEKDIATSLIQMKPTCSQDLLKKKWSELITSFGNYIKGLLLPNVDKLPKEFNQWTDSIMADLRRVNWTEVKLEILEVANMVNGFADKIITNVNNSRDKKRTLKGLVKNYVCGLNITDFSKLDEKFLEKLINTFGKLDICTEAEQDEAWDRYLDASVKSWDWLKEINGSISISDILKYITDEHIQSIQTIVREMIKVKWLDDLIGTVWQNMKKNSNQELSVDYILRFMACNVKISEITKLDGDKLMNIAAKFGQPVKCNTQNGNDWLTDFLKLLLKLDSDMNFQQLDELDKYLGGFTTQNLKQFANKVKKLKDLAMASLNKVAKKSDEWISYVEKNNSLDISAIGRHLVCFFAKGDFSSFETTIISLGEFGQCTASESKKEMEDLLKELNKMSEGELLKEFLTGLGVLGGEFNVKAMQNFITKVTGKLEEYLAKFWALIPTEIKELTIAKVLKMIGDGMAELDELLTCVVKSVVFPLFEQPNAPNFVGCFHRGGPNKKPGVKPGRKPGGKLADRYKVGDDFPFRQGSKADMDMLLKKLLDFTREPNSEKERRILHSVTNDVIDYLLKNQNKLDAVLSNNKKRILELAGKVNRGAQIMYKMKVDSESLSMVKKIATPQQARKLLKKAMTDMKMKTKSATEKKDFIQKLPSDVMMKSGTQLIDNFFSEETKMVFIKSFVRKKKTQTSKEIIEDDEEEDQQSLAKLSLVNKMMDKTSDNEALTLMMNTSLVSVISINMFKKLPQKEMCSMKAETMDLKEDQIQYLINSCPKAVEEIAKTNATSLGKIATKVTKQIVNNLNLKELTSLTSEACRYERSLDIDLEKVFKDRYITEKLNPMNNATNMFCVLKYVKTELPWQQPEAIEICKTLGNSILKKIPSKRAEFFKSKCMDLLKKGNITFADMGSMNAFLKKVDIENLKPETILQGAVVLAGYVWDSSVFDEVGKKLSDITSFKKHSNLTTDQVAQAGIFIAAWSDADTIPKDSVLQTFDSIATSVSLLQKKKLLCQKNGQDSSKCNVMDKTIAKIVQILIKAMTDTNSRRKRSTKASCHCSNLVNLGVAAVQVPASQMSQMICDTDFDDCMEGLSQITDWNEDHRKVFVQKALKVWGQPKEWKSSNVAIASAVIPGLSADQIKVLPLDSVDTTFFLGKQNNWRLTELTETFVLFLKNLKNNNISTITSFDLQALGNIVCGISTDYIQLIPKLSYINAASQIGSLEICSPAQLAAWAKKALAVYGNNINEWGLAEIASIGSVISGFSTLDLQKLNEKQIAAISVKTIPKILPEKLANLHPVQIGYLTSSQVQMVTPAQKAQMTEEQKDILNKKVVGAETTAGGKNGVFCFYHTHMELSTLSRDLLSIPYSRKSL